MGGAALWPTVLGCGLCSSAKRAFFFAVEAGGREALEKSKGGDKGVVGEGSLKGGSTK